MNSTATIVVYFTFGRLFNLFGYGRKYHYATFKYLVLQGKKFPPPWELRVALFCDVIFSIHQPINQPRHEDLVAMRERCDDEQLYCPSACQHVRRLSCCFPDFAVVFCSPPAAALPCSTQTRHRLAQPRHCSLARLLDFNSFHFFHHDTKSSSGSFSDLFLLHEDPFVAGGTVRFGPGLRHPSHSCL